MRKLFSLLLVIVMLVSMTACSTSEAPATEQAPAVQATGEPAAAESGEKTIDFNEEPYTINVCFPVTGDAQADLLLVQEAVSEITLREINATVVLEPVNLSSMANIFNLKMAGGEKMDLMMLLPAGRHMPNFAASNLIQPIDQYLADWGPDILEILGESITAGQYKGQQWCVPQNNFIRKSAAGFSLSQRYLDKYDIKLEDIKSLEDLEEVFAIIAENEPEVIVLAPEAAGQVMTGPLAPDGDNAGKGYLHIDEDENGKLVVSCSVGSDASMAAARKIREWYNNGWISKDVAVTQDGGKQLISAGKCFATTVAQVNVALGEEGEWPTRYLTFDMNKPVVCTSNLQTYMWGIASSCERPDKAIQFLNLCFASAELTNLLKYGIEGQHYEMLDNGMVELTNQAGYRMSWQLYGDCYKQYVRADTALIGRPDITPEEYMQLRRDFDESCELSPAFGFVFDTSAVQAQVGACDNVVQEFSVSIGCGTVDPETEVPKYLQKLYDAGLQDILDECQRQLDEWQANR